VPPLASAGRWITDAKGRVVQLRGVNEVAKRALYYPSALGFGADDARFLARHGFNSVRLGINFRLLMPEPGEIDHEYIDRLAETVRVLGRRGIYVLLDFHQDGFSPRYRGDGLPDWMAIDDGLTNPSEPGFPQYYFANPAMQRAFESLWEGRPGPGGVSLHDYFAEGVGAVAERFGHSRYVVGYDVLNEPLPGASWAQCVQPAGCPEQEAELAPLYEAATDAIRRWTSRQLVFVEPYLLFNTGAPATSLPGADSGNGLSFHSYTTAEKEPAVVGHAVNAARRDGAPLIATEFGATTDAAALTRLTAGFDARLVPWMFWAYNESVIADPSRRAGMDNLASPSGFRALVRPYPKAIAGTPKKISFDPASGAFDLRYSTRPPAGRRSGRPPASVVYLPRLVYPDGYEVDVKGARVGSRPCGRALLLRSRRGVRSVSLEVRPRGRDCAGSAG
jgi:endoglycosylceramidase